MSVAAAHPLLRAATPAGWIARACESPDVLLIDHANCEKKAASTALALMFAYAGDLELADKMSRLAREELRHFEQVARLIRRSSAWAPAAGSGPLRRAPAPPGREDRAAARGGLMICGAVIEARSCERFAAVSPALGGELGKLFQGLHAAEARHFKVYLDLARRAALRAGVDLPERIDEFASLEADLILGRDELFRFHSGDPSRPP